jgi:hypothetical protein
VATVLYQQESTRNNRNEQRKTTGKPVAGTDLNNQMGVISIESQVPLSAEVNETSNPRAPPKSHEIQYVIASTLASEVAGEDPLAPQFEADSTDFSDFVANLGTAKQLFDAQPRAPPTETSSHQFLLLDEAAVPSDDSGSITDQQLEAVTDEAIRQWSELDLSVEQRAILENLTVQVSDLSGNRLGSAIIESGVASISVDTDAAGHGWFVDSSPQDNNEFEADSNSNLTVKLMAGSTC